MSSVASSSFSYEGRDLKRHLADFERWTSPRSEIAPPVAAINVLVEVIRQSNATTMMELERQLQDAKSTLLEWKKSMAIESGCELFLRHVTRTSLDIPNFEECKTALVERGLHFANISETSRLKIAEIGVKFLPNDVTVLLYGYSRVVMRIIRHAVVHLSRRFSVIACECGNAQEGFKVASELTALGVPVTVVPDTAMAYVMERVDMVLIGAESVVENGGIINVLGTYQLSIISKTFNRPLYVAVESYKFARVYPLTQQDVLKYRRGEGTFPIPDHLIAENARSKLKTESPDADYTPPEYITLMFTDLGVFTPSAVSDELIKLYQ